MFIAHLPAGYILGKAVTKSVDTPRNKLLLIFIMIGSIVPDIDLLYFYTLFQRLRIDKHHTFFYPNRHFNPFSRGQ